MGLDFSQINIVQTCETLSTSTQQSVLGVLTISQDNTKQCNDPGQTFWIVYALIIGLCYGTYKIACIIYN